MPTGGHPRLALSALAVAAVALGASLLIARSPGKKPRNVVLISIDTCRADHLGCYGYSPRLTPNVDALAGQGVRFTSVITPFPMTLPAHCSMLTGLYPKTHGVRANGIRLGGNSLTLAKVLRSAGYQTAGFVGGFPMSARFGLGQGFETYDDRLPEVGHGLDPECKAEVVSRRGMEWLEQHGGQPFFLFLHYYDPHFPYDPPSPFPQTYDGELAYVDLWIGKVMEKMRALGRDDDTLVVVAGDHGEGLGEHGETEHGFLVYQNTLSVPLIVRCPAGRPHGSRVDENVSLVDVMPTVLGLLGLRIPRQVQGVDLSGFCGAGVPPAAAKTPAAGPRPMYSETLWPELYDCNPMYCVIEGTWKYIQSRRPELYDLSRDGAEKVNLVDQEPARARQLRGRLEALQKAMPAAADSPGGAGASLDKDTLRRLESLGYVGGGVGRERLDSDPALEDPKDFVALFERCKTAFVLLAQRRYPEAEKLLLEVVSLRPRLFLVRYALAAIAVEEHRPADAIRQLKTALSLLTESKNVLTPSSLEAITIHARQCQHLLGRALVMDGKPDQGLVELQSVLSADPDSFSIEDHLELTALLAARGRFSDAVADCRMVLKTDAQNALARNRLAWMLATCPDASVRDGAEAVKVAWLLVQGSRQPMFLDTLAAAYAETGQFPKAVATAEDALALAKSSGRRSEAQRMQTHLMLYRAGRPYRETPQSAGP